MFANGGIFLFIAHITIFTLVTFLAVQNLRRNSQVIEKTLPYLCAWLAFAIQSLVNINNLGLVIWGWAMMGIIAGRRYSKPNVVSINNIKKSSNQKVLLNRRITTVATVTFSAILTILATLPFRQDIQFKKIVSRKTAEIDTMLSVINTFPRNDFYASTAARLFLKAELYKEADLASRISIESNPNNVEAFEIIRENPISSKNQKIWAERKIRIFNPLQD
jgi:hypothetical protein